MSEKEKKCIESWKEKMPDYEIARWDESNFNVKECAYVEQAYQKEKYAFVSDYARAKILYEYGGIYMDTDVMAIKSFDEIGLDRAFLGFERMSFLGTAVIGCEPGNEVIKEVKDYYENHDFVQEDGNHATVANVALMTVIMKTKGLKLGGERQYVAGFEVYGREIFYPKKLDENKYRLSSETVVAHLGKNSWVSEREKNRDNKRKRFGRKCRGCKKSP